MKIYSKPINTTKYNNILNFPEFYNDRALYIDIETTGFMRNRDMIYLVGLLYKEKDELILTQYLCEKKEDEYELLFKLNQLVTEFDCLVHFNGDSFDLPFIKARMEFFHIKENISALDSYDFYKAIKTYKHILKTDNFKLKTLEAICGYERIDPFDGGQLISLYKQYLDGDLNLEYSFVIHNEEDMIGLYYINSMLPLLTLGSGYETFYYDKAHWDKETLTTFHYPLNEDNKNNNLFNFSLSVDKSHIEFDEKGLTITFEAEFAEKKLFFPDYENYFYLPEEDMAYHKNVAAFMSSKYRKKATVKTAYTKHTGNFIQLPISRDNLIEACVYSDSLTPEELQSFYVFNDTHKEKHCYILQEDLIKLNHPILIRLFFLIIGNR